MYSPIEGRFLSEDPLGFDSGDTNPYRFAGNDPTNKIDPSGLADLSPGSYFDVENATGLFGEWMERTAESAAQRLGMDEGFENKWAEKKEMRESFQTAEEDDIIVFLGHRYFKGDEKTPTEVGVMPATDIPGYDLFARYVGTTYSLDEMIDDINKRPGAPAMIFFAGCDSRVLAQGIIDRTATKVVVGTDRNIGLGAARELIKALASRLGSDKTLAEAIAEINAERKGRAQLTACGSAAALNTPIRKLLKPKKAPAEPYKAPYIPPATIFGPYPLADDAGNPIA